MNDGSPVPQPYSRARLLAALTGAALTFGALACSSFNSTGIATFSANGTAANGTVTVASVDPMVRWRVTAGTADAKQYEWRAIASAGYEYMQLRKINDANTVFTDLAQFWNNGKVAFPVGPLVVGTDPGGSEIARFGGGLRCAALTATNGNIQPTAGQFLNTSTLSAGTYSIQVFGAAGAARDIATFGQLGFSNGFTVRYNGSSMVYTMLDGALVIGADPGGSESLRVNGQARFASSIITGQDGASVNLYSSAGLVFRDSGSGTNSYIDLSFGSASHGSLTVRSSNAATVLLQLSITGASFYNSVTCGALYIGANQVVGARGAAVADATDAATAISQLNALLARCRAHGLIA